MIDKLLTNYNIKFNPIQLDNDLITNNKFYYKIYNNKINEPLHKFWFSVCDIKYLNNYNNYKTVRFLMNNKSEEISNLINFIKDLGNYLVNLFGKIFPNISVDFPWKEIEQYPFVFSVFTNNNTILLDSNSNNINFNDLSNTDTYSIIFEISSIKLLPIVLDDHISSFTIKINLSLLLLKINEKKNLKDYIFNTIKNDNKELFNSYKQITKTHSLPFLNEISTGTTLKKNIDLSDNTKLDIKKNISLIIDKEQLLMAKNTLKKVNNDKNEDESDDNKSNRKNEYIDKKNTLRKVKTEVKSLLNHLKSNKEIIKNKNKNKKNKNKKKEKELELELELERELEKELERELENIIK